MSPIYSHKHEPFGYSIFRPYKQIHAMYFICFENSSRIYKSQAK